MIAVADAGPLHYLVLIGAVPVLEPLYKRLLVPKAVVAELQEPNTPAMVRAWIAQPPQWCEIPPDPPFDPTLLFLDAGAVATRHFVTSSRCGRLATERVALATPCRSEDFEYFLQLEGGESDI